MPSGLNILQHPDSLIPIRTLSPCKETRRFSQRRSALCRSCRRCIEAGGYCWCFLVVLLTCYRLTQPGQHCLDTVKLCRLSHRGQRCIYHPTACLAAQRRSCGCVLAGRAFASWTRLLGCGGCCRPCGQRELPFLLPTFRMPCTCARPSAALIGVLPSMPRCWCSAPWLPVCPLPSVCAEAPSPWTG